MRRSRFALLLLASSCAHIQLAHEETITAEAGCEKIPVPLEARYKDGKLMIRGTPLDGEGAAQWEYFDERGHRAVVEKSLTPHDRAFTVYYPNGQKKLEAAFRRSEEDWSVDVQSTQIGALEVTTRYSTKHTTAHKVMVQRPHGAWELFNEDGTPLARALFSNGELLEREQWDATGALVEWSLPENIFEFKQLRMLVAAKPEYPVEPERLGIEGRTCTLVCVDQEGKLRGMFALTQAPKEFESAARSAIRQSRYEPEAIGEIQLPACMAMQTLFKAPHAADPPRRMLALGDSYTIGEGVDEKDRWPVQLVESLNKSGISLPDPEIIARTGWTTRELLSEVERLKPRGPYGLVTVLVGVNDAVQGVTPEAYRRELRRLLGKAVELSGGRPSRLLVLSIPDWSVTPFAAGRDRESIASDIDVLNRVAEEEAQNVGALWIDITDLSREAAADRSLLAGDRLHPSAKMYAAWVERVRQTAGNAVAKK